MAAPCWLFRNARYGFGRIKSTPPQFRITASVLRASTSPPKDSPNSIVKPLAKTGLYVFSKFKFFLEGYDKILRKFPVAYRLHQVFVVGTKDLYQDVRTYMKISQDLRSGKSVRELSRRELELYYRVPRDILKMAPILTIISLPGTNFIMFPLIYLFPGHLLTWQFWSLEQRIDFAVAQQKKKVHNYRYVFRHLQTNVPKGEEGKPLLSVFHKLGSGTHPTVAEILDIKQYFSSKPLSLSSLGRNHLALVAGCTLQDSRKKCIFPWPEAPSLETWWVCPGDGSGYGTRRAWSNGSVGVAMGMLPSRFQPNGLEQTRHGAVSARLDKHLIKHRR
nr:LETM1 domain-containing protein 1-like isoform X2 [Dermacentor andersoni]